MGLYDFRCMISGVSLKGAEAVAVLLRDAGSEFQPLALPIFGNYNRVGSIDGIWADSNTALVLDYFLDKLGTGELSVDEDYIESHELWPIENIEDLLTVVERSHNDNPKAMLLQGKPIKFALICRAVWDGIARSHPQTSPQSDSDRFNMVFKSSEIAAAIYADKLAGVSRLLIEAEVIRNFMAKRRIAWRPTSDSSQHYEDEMHEYLSEARRLFADSPEILRGLEWYKNEVSELLGDEDQAKNAAPDHTIPKLVLTLRDFFATALPLTFGRYKLLLTESSGVFACQNDLYATFQLIEFAVNGDIDNVREQACKFITAPASLPLPLLKDGLLQWASIVAENELLQPNAKCPVPLDLTCPDAFSLLRPDRSLRGVLAVNPGFAGTNQY